MKAVVERSIAELVLYKGRQGIAVAREQPTLHCPALSKIMYPRFWLLSVWQTRHCEGLSEGKKKQRDLHKTCFNWTSGLAGNKNVPPGNKNTKICAEKGIIKQIQK